MKTILLLSLVLSTSAAFAKGQVFCMESGKIINVLSQDGFDCQGALYTGDVCFTGDIREATQILNSQEVRDMFDGTDGEYIKGARAKDANSIGYTAVDEANEWSTKVVIKRCLGSFFRN